MGPIWLFFSSVVQFCCELARVLVIDSKNQLAVAIFDPEEIDV
jgi:hypothetical protein